MKAELTRRISRLFGSAGGRWLAPGALLLAALALQYAAGLSPALIDRLYSRTVYFYLGRALSLVNRFFPFSLGEALIILLPLAGLPVTLWMVWRRLKRGAPFSSILLGGLRALVWLFGGGLLLFLLIWGLNYQRLPLAVNLGLAQREPETSEIEAIARSIIASVNRQYAAALGEGAPEAASRMPLSREQLYAALEEAFRREPLLGEASQGGFGPPKPVLLSSLMTRLGVSGIFSPFTGEPNYNAEQPDCDLPYTIAHEMAHQRGFAREDEANFIAFLVCIKSSHPYLRYSGYLRALRVLAALRAQVEPEKYREVVAELAAGPIIDARASAEFWQRHRSPTLSRAAESANNAYLQANRVRSGIRNYGEVVALIIGYYLTYPPHAD